MVMCYHTYVRWVDNVATCAVCSEQFNYRYDPQFVGTFPRENLELQKHKPEWMYNSTTTLSIPKIIRLDE
jgi:hypothetical protein